jgi:hypothetical protein
MNPRDSLVTFRAFARLNPSRFAALVSVQPGSTQPLPTNSAQVSGPNFLAIAGFERAGKLFAKLVTVRR